MQFEIKNRFSGVVQFTAEIEADDNTRLSIKIGLAVRRALKTGADLHGADLGGHKLADGNSFAVLGTPDDWHASTYFTDQGVQRIQVGCRDFTIPKARTYWENKPARREIMAAIDYAESIARVREWGAKKLEAA